jgi:hypothetical protein
MREKIRLTFARIKAVGVFLKADQMTTQRPHAR